MVVLIFNCFPFQELIERITKLEKGVSTLTATLKRRETSPLEKLADRKAKKKEIDFSVWKQRRIALKLMYLGWEYHGLNVQQDTSETIEDYIYEALLKVKLIRNRKEAGLQKCGRTDKGVCAFSQVLSINVRTSVEEGLGVFEPEDYREGTHHDRYMDYCLMLNKALPPQIRCLAWSAVHRDWHARFDCKSRTYRYFFPSRNLDTTSMLAAAKHLVGSHDFTNFCKRSREKVDPVMIRLIFSVSFFPLFPERDKNDPTQLYVFEISANGFLWHQIRCIMSVLMYVGQGKESPEVVKTMLDVEKVSKPQYPLASEVPLVLYDSYYEPEQVNWVYDKKCLMDSLKALQSIGSTFYVKSQMIQAMIGKLATDHDLQPVDNNQWLVVEKRRNHKPLLERPKVKSSSDSLLDEES